MNRKGVHGAPIVRGDLFGEADELIRRRARGPQHSFAVPAGHCGDPTHKVAQIVCEVDVVALVVPLPREIAVAAERNLLDQIQPQRIGAEAGRRVDRIDDRPQRLAHALTVHRHEAVTEHLPRQRQRGGHQHRRPDDRVKARDVLANDVQVGGPPAIKQITIAAEADRRRVIDQRVEPDIDNVRRVPRQRDAP